ncbi:helix-hairpin-helix domain-containing protein [Ornithinibacillus sp. BX22]|uniref:Helix-hairpin-helix domain-containing protein n=2 Tax=Ornithinibacillus TaxID=484508 RepID=A0A923L4P2_9BACI|nr:MULTISPECIES: helix-hairpin-helix domain-containing protein [Ornithinibacillus]MBC5636340.1 helix-hairpin-helix domain-containing protein [Ornithinibacillus hominis]MBS3681180.1 helix-hairpin-helix domain-containing protein [Ornithinibacillus massiliensis]
MNLFILLITLIIPLYAVLNQKNSVVKQWIPKNAWLLSFVLFAMILSGCSAAYQLEEAQATVVELEGVIDEKDTLIAEYEEHIQELSKEKEDLEEQLVSAESELDKLQEKYEDKIADLQDEISSLESNSTKTATTKSAESTTASSNSDSSSDSSNSCGAGTVHINSASESELQAIYQVGPERASQIVSLRPFSSYSDLKRVKGIGDKHAEAIENQGIICFD